MNERRKTSTSSHQQKSGWCGSFTCSPPYGTAQCSAPEYQSALQCLHRYSARGLAASPSLSLPRMLQRCRRSIKAVQRRLSDSALGLWGQLGSHGPRSAPRNKRGWPLRSGEDTGQTGQMGSKWAPNWCSLSPSTGPFSGLLQCS